MKRRNFVEYLSLGALAGIPVMQSSVFKASNTEQKHSFKLKYAPHFGMFKNLGGNDLLRQLDFMAEMGFTAFEDNGMKGRSLDTQKAIAERLEKYNMTMGVFVAHKIYWNEANLASGKKDKLDEFLNDIKDSVEVAKRVNAKWMTVVPGHVDLRLKMGYQTKNVMDALSRACEILEPHELTMVLEPLNFRDHPGLFLSRSDQAFSICSGIGSSSCKILFDIYHQQITEGNLIPNIEKCWDEIDYFQIGDNPGRKEPTTGEINYKNVFKYIHERGFEGVLGMEHGNSIQGGDGEKALIEAYVESDSF